MDRQDFLKTLAEACQKTLGYYLAAPEHRPRWVRVDRLLGEHGLPQDTPAARQEFERRRELRRLETGDEESLKALLTPPWLSSMSGGIRNLAWPMGNAY